MKCNRRHSQVLADKKLQGKSGLSPNQISLLKKTHFSDKHCIAKQWLIMTQTDEFSDKNREPKTLKIS